jgi:hypothetical protein
MTTTALLVQASLVITSYELLKTSIIDEIQTFFADEWREGVWLDSDEYQREVLRDGMSRLAGSLAWLQRNDVLTADQVSSFERLRAERNRLTHELADVLLSPAKDVDTSVISAAVEIAESLGRFWGGIAVDTDPAFDGQVVDYDAVRSGTSVLLDHLTGAALFAQRLREMAADVSVDDGPAGP